MKCLNPKFAGMQTVTPSAVHDRIQDYYPNTSQIGGARRLALLKKATNLSELIDFCIEGYRAWGDAVLMGAGAYLKIGNFVSEISCAKEYVKRQVFRYLNGAPFASLEEYDSWHETVCTTLADGKTYFVEYAAYRKTSTDSFTNKFGFTVGNAQKFLNMLMKDLYACLSVDPTFLPSYKDYFTYCHMPLDSYILRFVDDIRFREGIKKPARCYKWGNLNDYSSYMDEQNDIRNYVSKYNPSVTVLETEFFVWPLYK